jgi:hypothetical protein
MSDAPKTTQYELPTGAIAILEEILPSPQWYKDDPKQARMIVNSVAAAEALPDLAERPSPEKDEKVEAFKARAEAWAGTNMMLDWTEKQVAAVKVCVKFYLKSGNLAASKQVAALICALQLDDE